MDDSKLMRILLSRISTRAGYQVTEAADVESAMARLTDGDYDLVITDLQMSGADGWDLLEMIRSSHMPPAVVIVSGEDDPASFADALERGALDYIAKPFTPDRILRTMELAAKRRQGAPLPS